MTVRFLSVDSIEALHKRTIERFGGSHGLRDRGLLESAVARAENHAYYQPEASVAELAATLAWGLIKNHAFIDGNKRIGVIALFTFLDMNGYRLLCSEEEETGMVLRASLRKTSGRRGWCGAWGRFSGFWRFVSGEGRVHGTFFVKFVQFSGFSRAESSGERYD